MSLENFLCLLRRADKRSFSTPHLSPLMAPGNWVENLKWGRELPEFDIISQNGNHEADPQRS